MNCEFAKVKSKNRSRNPNNVCVIIKLDDVNVIA